MKLPQWIEFTLFIAAWVLAAVRIRYGLKAYAARRSIFGGERRLSRVGVLSNSGYAIVAFLLGIYFLLSYRGSGAAMPVLNATVFVFLAVLLIEISCRRRT